MALATLAQVLASAEQTQTAIPSFNIDTLVGTQALLRAAEKERSPLILTVGQKAIQEGRMVYLADLVQRMALESRLPIVLHLDHSTSYEQILEAIRLGFTSVMYDGSSLPLSENIRRSQQAVRAARKAGVCVECELGAIRGVEDGAACASPNLVDLREAEIFIREVDCDALAVGIGNAHGIYRAAPRLDFDRLGACRAMGAPPLVLHGGSGIPDEMILRAISLGVRKINVATELRLAFLDGLREAVQTGDFYETLRRAETRTFELADRKIRLFQKKEPDA